ncbi:2'-5' RNA ligase [Candidatus Daviesbacteria bacterium RIFCSPHIGHO2_02_FULL_36_13]|uniref:RNA 2',3'-cyclic phosphodiesterase n=1 Tax=Candidatus Daviesbacteria bacterium RIFCSPHIGHO2_02_FULL_36_13 TaxID=1797768 RepID=A0A1F5JRR1_9BACT|nr:MAG: 2'-5' RNA ligase [Candidatus Daviesbacteria bacterium RIFCSPHIGHO2_02_FULL_36_13]OGE44181.1 MAG: 2'-5' RNA ligase [Candidatus Daviesbacteria bacterium RIFCSPLOWO2_01_FULL_36_8]
MRFFIALEIPSENSPQFQAIQDRLSTLITQVRLTSLDKIHLTLAFLGEQSDDLVPKLTEILEEAAKNISPFEVTPAYIDGFPDIHNPNILWVGVKGDIDKVLQIRERIKDGLASIQLPVDERRFIPHITIAKFNETLKVDKDLEVGLEKLMAQPFDPIRISSIKLFESVPNQGFHSHNVLAEVQLGK